MLLDALYSSLFILYSIESHSSRQTVEHCGCDYVDRIIEPASRMTDDRVNDLADLTEQNIGSLLCISKEGLF